MLVCTCGHDEQQHNDQGMCLACACNGWKDVPVKVKSARGVKARGVSCFEMKKIAIGFPEATFDRISQMAHERQIPFGAMVREIVDGALKGKP